MKFDVLMVLAPSTDPRAYLHPLENAEEFGRVDICRGDTTEGWQQAVTAFTQNYSVVITDLLFDHSAIGVGIDGLTASQNTELTFPGFQLIQEGWDISRVSGQQANYVVLSQWNHIDNVYEAYRQFARSFITRQYPPTTDEFLQSTLKAAKGITTYPNLSPKETNIAKAFSNEVFGMLSLGEVEMVDLLVNDLSTKQIQQKLESKSIASTNERIALVLRKIGLNTRDELVAHALDIGLEKHSS